MTGVAFKQFIHYLTQTNDVTLTDGEIVMLANVAKDDLAKEVAAEDQGIFGAIAYKDLQANVREYTFPENQLNSFDRLEVSFDGVKFRRLEKINDKRLLDIATNEAAIVAYFNDTTRYGYYIYRKSLFVNSGAIADVEDGLKLFFTQYPADITTGTLASTDDLSSDPSDTTSGFPRELHYVWAVKVSILFKTSKPQPIPLTEREQSFEVDLAKALRAVRYTDKNGIDQLYTPRSTGYDY